MGQKKRNQHYVPQFILKNFIDSESDSNILYVYDKVERRFFYNSKSHIGSENDFYTLPGEKEKYRWDNFYTEKEGDFSDTYHTLISCINDDCFKVDSIKLKKSFSRFLAIQLMRGKKYKDFPIRNKDAVFRIWSLLGIKDGTLMDIPKDYLEFSATFEPVIKMITIVFFDKSWIFYKSSESLFITSDSPITVYDYKSYKSGQFIASMKDTTSVIGYPINSKIMLLMFNVDYTEDLKDKDMSIWILKKDKVREEVLKRNHKDQLDQCCRFIYGTNESLIRNVVEENGKG